MYVGRLSSAAATLGRVTASRWRWETHEGRAQRERVLRAATELFAAHGFRGTSLDAVATAVGITRQGVLHYFPSKTHLLLGVLEQRDEDDAAGAQRYRDTSDLPGALLSIIERHRAQPELPRLNTVLVAETVNPEHPAHARFRDRYRANRARTASAVEAAQAAGRLNPAADPTRLATVLLAVMDGLQLQFLLDPESVDMVEPFAELLALLQPHAVGE